MVRWSVTYWKSWVDLGGSVLKAQILWLMLSLLLTLELVGNGSLILCWRVRICLLSKSFLEVAYWSHLPCGCCPDPRGISCPSWADRSLLVGRFFGHQPRRQRSYRRMSCQTCWYDLWLLVVKRSNWLWVDLEWRLSCCLWVWRMKSYAVCVRVCNIYALWRFSW